jgi:hypothetical protein
MVSIRRPVSRLGEPSRLWMCYEAGPTGYVLHRLLTATPDDSASLPWR